MRHFTCSHGAAGIVGQGRVMPRPGLVGVPVSWWTDLAEPDVIGLGLTSVVLACDRTAFAFDAADVTGIMPWLLWSAWNVPPDLRDLLAHDGARPDRWYVALAPVPVVPALIAVGQGTDSRESLR